MTTSTEEGSGTTGGRSHSDVADRNDARNALINIVEGALFIGGSAFISFQIVIPVLVSRLGGGNVAVGAVGLIAWVGLFLPQIFAARYVEMRPWKKPWAIGFGAANRSVVVLIGLAVVTFGVTNPNVALWLLLILYLVGQVLLGIATPGWFDLFAKLTPAHKRGRLVGIRNSLGGGVAFICGVGLTWFLRVFSFPVSYALAFFAAGGVQFLSLAVQAQLIEGEPSPVAPARPMFAFLRELPDVFRQNPEFKRFILASVFIVVAGMPVAFFTVYALKTFPADESLVGEFTLTIVAAQMLSAVATGFIADHYGNKIALIVAVCGMLCASICAMFAPSLGWFRLVYVFYGINLGSELMARFNLSIEYGPVHQRSTYIGLMNTILAPCYLASIVGGWMSDAFGYVSVFGVGAAASLIGVTLLTFRVKDPRVARAQTIAVAPGTVEVQVD
jgi:MFS family permease